MKILSFRLLNFLISKCMLLKLLFIIIRFLMKQFLKLKSINIFRSKVVKHINYWTENNSLFYQSYSKLAKKNIHRTIGTWNLSDPPFFGHQKLYLDSSFSSAKKRWSSIQECPFYYIKEIVLSLFKEYRHLFIYFLNKRHFWQNFTKFQNVREIFYFNLCNINHYLY